MDEKQTSASKQYAQLQDATPLNTPEATISKPSTLLNFGSNRKQQASAQIIKNNGGEHLKEEIKNESTPKKLKRRENVNPNPEEHHEAPVSDEEM